MQERAERLPLIVAGGDSDFGVHASSGRTSRVWIALALSDVRMRCRSVRSSIGRAFAIGASSIRERRADPDVRFMRGPPFGERSGGSIRRQYLRFGRKVGVVSFQFYPERGRAPGAGARDLRWSSCDFAKRTF